MKATTCNVQVPLGFDPRCCNVWIHSWICVQTRHIDRFQMVKCQRTEMWNAHMFLITCVIWSWSVRPWASPYNHPLDDLRIVENAVYLHLCQRISSLELSSVFPLKGCHKSGEDNQSFYFLLERWIWEPFPRLGTEKVWILNPTIVFKIRPILNKLIWMFSVCFSLGAVETIRFGRLHNVFLASCFFSHGVGT